MFGAGDFNGLTHGDGSCADRSTNGTDIQAIREAPRVWLSDGRYESPEPEDFMDRAMRVTEVLDRSSRSQPSQIESAK
jgi:hypothetical protein